MPRSHCTKCAQLIEFPPELSGQTIQCPNCQQQTALMPDAEPAVHVITPVQKRSEAWDRGIANVAPLARRIADNIEQVIVGKRNEIQLALVALFAEGHLLLEDVPGVAKTMLARALAQSVGGHFKRIQCTPDLLPNDITGASIFSPKTAEFEFRPGPIFAQIVLADEINRATPRAQSALLEAMAERKVTVDGINYDLRPPFFLIATQNPIDHEGTFPLPEAQLDRFLIKMSLGYPTLADEARMLDKLRPGHPIDALQAAVSIEDVLLAQKAVREVNVDTKVRDYILQLTHGTRTHEAVRLGASPRSSLALYRAAQAYAAIQGDDYVLPDYVKQIAPHVLPHRLVVKPESRLRRVTGAGVVEEIVRHTPVPMLAAGR